MLESLELQKTLAKVRGSERIQQVRRVQDKAGEKSFDQQLAQQKEKAVSQGDTDTYHPEAAVGDDEHQDKRGGQDSVDTHHPESEPNEGTPDRHAGRTETLSLPRSGLLGAHVDVVA